MTKTNTADKVVIALEKVSCHSIEKRLKSRKNTRLWKNLKSIYSTAEWNRAGAFARPEEALAARLAAKRALKKALRVKGFFLTENLFNKLEITNRRNGSPALQVIDARLRKSMFPPKTEVFLSLTHSTLWGIAAVALKT